MSELAKKQRNLLHLKSTNEILMLLGGMLLCILILLILPSGSGSAGKVRLTDEQYAKQMNSATEKYQLARTMDDRIAAAREMKTLKSQHESELPPLTFDNSQLLRMLLTVTILLLSIKLVSLAWIEYARLAKAGS